MIDDSDEASSLSDQTLDHVPHADIDAAAHKRREEKRARAALIDYPDATVAKHPRAPSYKWMNFWVTIGIVIGLLLIVLFHNALSALAHLFDHGG